MDIEYILELLDDIERECRNVPPGSQAYIENKIEKIKEELEEE